MDETTGRKAAILVLVKHPEKGEAENGRAICDEIRRSIAGSDEPLSFMHDATHMATANPAYASEFKALDREIAGRLVEVVCAIPGSIPRMLAHTVAMFSEKDWEIFKELQDALGYLRTKGFGLSTDDVASAGEVSIWKSGRMAG